MMKGGWLFFTALRWGFSAKGGKSLKRAVLASAGIAAGVIALIVVIGVMGGLQSGYIEDVLEISSFHVRVEIPDGEIVSALHNVKQLKGVKSAVAFKEVHVLAEGSSGRAVPLTLRSIGPDAISADRGFARALGLAQGDWHFPEGGIMVGKQAALSIGAGQGGEVSLMGVRQDEQEGILPVETRVLCGLPFASGYFEYDSSLAFADYPPPDPLARFFSNPVSTIGIKLENRFLDYAIMDRIIQVLPKGSKDPVSWREYNRSFFGALRTEKAVMMALISLIFIVVGLNIAHSMRRTIAAKMQDIAVLKAVGADDKSIRNVFMLEGFLVGSAGSVAGTTIGLIVLGNLNPILDAASRLSRWFTGLFASGGNPAASEYRLFSPAYFYIDAVPVSIEAIEIVFIILMAVASSLIAAASASRYVSRATPLEVLRNE